MVGDVQWLCWLAGVASFSLLLSDAATTSHQSCSFTSVTFVSQIEEPLSRQPSQKQPLFQQLGIASFDDDGQER